MGWFLPWLAERIAPVSRAIFGVFGCLAIHGAAAEQLLNVSFDASRELFSEINRAFVPWYKQKTGRVIGVLQSHGGSSKQARSVIDGVDADVITMNTVSDIDLVARRGKLLSTNWRSMRANSSSPYSSIVVLVVRENNPKGIRDWPDLLKPEVTVAVTNPKTSGNGRNAYLAAWVAALDRAGGDEVQAREYVRRLYSREHVRALDTGARGAAITFVQRGIGDALITLESEYPVLVRAYPEHRLELVRPPLTLDVEMTVAVVERIARKHKKEDAAAAYLDFMESAEGQRIIAKNHFRPRMRSVLDEFRNEFPPVRLAKVDETLGGWDAVMAKHFAEGGIFDQITTRSR